MDRFLSTGDLKPYRVYHRGEPTGRAGVDHEDSGFSVEVSEADGNLNIEVEDAVRFLREHEKDLSRLANDPEISDRRLDFGYYHREVFMQSEYLPVELLLLCGRLGIAIELSLYPKPDESK